MTGPRRLIDIERYKFPHPGHYTVHDAFCDYARERLIAKGKDCQRAWIGFNYFMDVVPPPQAVVAITTGQIADFIEYRMASCTSPLTPRRELSFVKAAIHNAHRRNRIQVEPYIELPDGECRERRPLTAEEYRLVMRQPMSKRLRRFYVVAYYTGHRAGAIQELTWDRVDFARLVIDFNVPGRPVTNKRRARDFPIPDEMLPRLEAWRAQAADDPIVISSGPDTYREADYVVRELAGLKDPTLVPRHCMRKMFATELFERQVDPEVVGKLLADDPNTLRAHYVKFKDSTLRAAANVRALGR